MTQLTSLESARAQLTKARTVQEAKDVRKLAERIRATAVRAGSGFEIVNFAAELKLQAERLSGQYLASMKLRGGNRFTGDSDPVRLKDMGIDKNQSARWQMEASVPETLFREFVQQEHAAHRELSTARLIRLARELRDQGADLLVASEDLMHNPVSTQSHLMSDEMVAIKDRNREFDAITEIVVETRNHHQLLSRLVRSACERSLLPIDSVDRRAIQRYLKAVEECLEELAIGLSELSRNSPLLPRAGMSV